uniref:Acyltransferase n=1 Tax=Anolis carolinensis TaxID=28377 RepID=H9GEW0_ANOCA
MKTIIAAYSQNQSGKRGALVGSQRPRDRAGIGGPACVPQEVKVLEWLVLGLARLSGHSTPSFLPRWPSRGDLRAWVQLLAVAQWMLSFLLMGLLLLLLLVYLAFTPFWPVSALYLAWLLLDWETPERGGRSSSWVRSWPIWSYFRDYFPIQLVKTHPLSPGHNYMVGVHPHGLLCVGAFANFVTGATGFAEKFPGIRPALGTLAGNFRLPGIREYLMSGGLFPVTPRAIAHLLSRSGTGNAVVLVVGGAAESLSASRPGETTLVLRRRKGFVRLALQHGTHLVPAFSFGEKALFRQVCFAEGRALGFDPCLFHGRGLPPSALPVATVGEYRRLPAPGYPSPKSEYHDLTRGRQLSRDLRVVSIAIFLPSMVRPTLTSVHAPF